MNWLQCVIFAAIAFAIHTGCLKVLGDKLPAALVTCCFYSVALLTTIGIVVFEKINPSSFTEVLTTRTVIIALVVAGVTIALTDYFFVHGFGLGAPMSLYGPLYSTLGFALIALIGVGFFSETLTASKLAGFAFAAIGFFLMVR